MNKALPSLFFVVCFIFVIACGESEDTKQSSPQITKAEEEAKSVEELQQKEPGASIPDNETANHPPQITSIKVVSISNSDPRRGFRAVAESKDWDEDEISFKYQWKINGEKIIGATEEVLQPEVDFKKGDNIAVEVVPSDGKEEGIWKAEGSFIVPNSPPRITSEPEARMEGGRFSYTVKAEDPDGDPVEFTLKGAPQGMMIEPQTGLVTWEFDKRDVGEHNVQVIASDPEGAKATQDLTLRIP